MESATTHLTDTGEPLWFRVVEDVSAGDGIAVRKGTLVQGWIRRAADAKSFGRGGQMNVVIPSIVAGDGTVIPTVGQTGQTRNQKESAVGEVQVAGMLAIGIVPGILAGGFVKGKEAFVLAGSRCSVWTTSEAWVSPAPGHVEAAPETSTVLPVSGTPEVVFKPRKRTGPKEIVFHLGGRERPSVVRLFRVGGWKLPEPVEASAIEAHPDGGWSCTFRGWDVIRFLRPAELTGRMELVLAGALEDGTAYVAPAAVELTLDAGK
jgi:hypothetical protein